MNATATATATAPVSLVKHEGRHQSADRRDSLPSDRMPSHGAGIDRAEASHVVYWRGIELVRKSYIAGTAYYHSEVIAWQWADED